MSELIIRQVLEGDEPEWLRMRMALWPEGASEAHRAEISEIIHDPDQIAFVAERPKGKLGGFLEVGTRKYAEGCESSPVGYIEGWYVDEDLRRQGIGSALVNAAEKWARSQGLTEMASDTWLENHASRQSHLKLGYHETDSLIHFVKSL